MLLRAFRALQLSRQANAAAAALAVPAASTTGRAAWPTATRAFSSSTTPPPPSNADADNDQAASSLSAMLEVMLSDDSARDALLSRLPERMRRPEVVRAMLQNPEVRARLGELARQTGMFGSGGAGGGSGLPDASALERGLAAARAAGIDAGKVAAKLATSPSLRDAARNPRVFAALLDICRNGPESVKKYEGDQEVLKAYFEAGSVLQDAQQEADGGRAAQR